MSRRALGIVMVAAALIGGCEQQQDLLSNLLIQSGAASELGYGIQWQTSLASSEGDRLIYFETLGDRIVTLESGNVLSVLDPASDEVIWSQRIGTRAERFSKPVRLEDRLLICSGSRAYLFDLAQGERLDALPLVYTTNTTPAVVNGTMIHGSTTGIVYAEELNLGLMRWEYQTGAAISTDPLLVEGKALVANEEGDLLAFEPMSGELLWRRSAYDSVSAPPTADEQRVYVASEDQSLYAFNLDDGGFVWRHYAESPLREPPVRMGDLLLIQEPDKGLLALDPESGEPVWRREGFERAKPLMIHGDGLYVYRPGAIEVLRPGDGRTLRSASVPKVEAVVAGDQGEGALYLIQGRGRILKLTPQ